MSLGYHVDTNELIVKADKESLNPVYRRVR
jgi:hypothetical protein